MSSDELISNNRIKKLIILIAGIAVIAGVAVFLLAAAVGSVYGVRGMVSGEVSRKEIGGEARELIQLREKQEVILNEYKWLDKESGKVRIPVQRAMEILVEETELKK